MRISIPEARSSSPIAYSCFIWRDAVLSTPSPRSGTSASSSEPPSIWCALSTLVPVVASLSSLMPASSSFLSMVWASSSPRSPLRTSMRTALRSCSLSFAHSVSSSPYSPLISTYSSISESTMSSSWLLESIFITFWRTCRMSRFSGPCPASTDIISRGVISEMMLVTWSLSVSRSDSSSTSPIMCDSFWSASSAFWLLKKTPPSTPSSARKRESRPATLPGSDRTSMSSRSSTSLSSIFPIRYRMSSSSLSASRGDETRENSPLSPAVTAT